MPPSKKFMSSIKDLNIKGFSGICFQCDFNTDNFDIQQSHTLSIDLPANLHRAVPKRQSEFLAGRYLALKALSKLGSKQTIVPVGRHRAPQWPKGIVGSISHTTDTACCVVSRFESHNYLGVDIERYLELNTATKIRCSIISEREMIVLDKLHMPFERSMTVVFSAKESLFKALYPKLGKYFDFLDVELVELDEEKKIFSLEVNSHLAMYLESRKFYHGSFMFQSKHVFTIVFS